MPKLATINVKFVNILSFLFPFRSTEGLEQVTDGNGAGSTVADYPGYDDWTKRYWMQLTKVIQKKIIWKISSCLLNNQFKIDFISQTYIIEQEFK